MYCLHNSSSNIIQFKIERWDEKTTEDEEEAEKKILFCL